MKLECIGLDNLRSFVILYQEKKEIRCNRIFLFMQLNKLPSFEVTSENLGFRSEIFFRVTGRVVWTTWFRRGRDLEAQKIAF